MKKKVALEGTVALLILLFLYSGLTQLLSFKFFYGNIYNQPIFQWSKPILVYTIPATQLLIAAGLFFERTRLAALWASLGLLTIFSLYIGLIIMNALARVPCSCAGVIDTFTWPQHLVFNLCFMALNVFALKLMKRPSTDDSGPVQVAAY